VTLSKKYYETIAKVLRETYASAPVIEGFIKVFEQDNPRFKPDLFRKASDINEFKQWIYVRTEVDGDYVWKAKIAQTSCHTPCSICGEPFGSWESYGKRYCNLCVPRNKEARDGS
jgi:hypothetical protein